MRTEQRGKELHDRATRGQALSADEQRLLEGWYARQDQAEADSLGLAVPVEPPSTLRGEVDTALARLAEATRRMQEISAENEGLRRENADLRRQLAQRAAK